VDTTLAVERQPLATARQTRGSWTAPCDASNRKNNAWRVKCRRLRVLTDFVLALKAIVRLAGPYLVGMCRYSKIDAFETELC
jgi:hypothetical protein